MGAVDEFHRLGLGAVTGDRTVMSMVKTHDLGQHMRVAGVGLRTGRGMPFAVAGH